MPTTHGSSQSKVRGLCTQQAPALPGHNALHPFLYDACQDLLAKCCWPALLPVCRLAITVPADGSKEAEKLEARYSLSSVLQSFQDKHDTVCDLVSQLALEVREIQCDKEKWKRSIDDQVRPCTAHQHNVFWPLAVLEASHQLPLLRVYLGTMLPAPLSPSKHSQVLLACLCRLQHKQRRWWLQPCSLQQQLVQA
jgi:hypothetical protein